MAVKKTSGKFPWNALNKTRPAGIETIESEKSAWKKHPKAKQIHYTVKFTDEKSSTPEMVLRAIAYAGVAEYPHHFYLGASYKTHYSEYEVAFRCPEVLGEAIIDYIAVHAGVTVYYDQDTAADWSRAREYEIVSFKDFPTE